MLSTEDINMFAEDHMVMLIYFYFDMDHTYSLSNQDQESFEGFGFFLWMPD